MGPLFLLINGQNGDSGGIVKNYKKDYGIVDKPKSND